jgi:hypothetical protein
MRSERERSSIGLGWGRRRWFPRWVKTLVASLSLALLLTSRGSAHNMSVPTGAQAELLAKLAGFDRNFAARAGGKAVVILAVMPKDSESMSAALEMKAALSRIPKVGDLPHEEHIVVHSNPAIRDAFSSVNALTVGGVPSYVPDGIVLGFDLVSGRPKLLVHLVQARKQQVAFPASVLNLMKVYP